MPRHRQLLATVRRELDQLEARLADLGERLEPRRLAALRAELAVLRDQYRAALAAGAELSDEQALALGHGLERLGRRLGAEAA